MGKSILLAALASVFAVGSAMACGAHGEGKQSVQGPQMSMPATVATVSVPGDKK